MSCGIAAVLLAQWWQRIVAPGVGSLVSGDAVRPADAILTAIAGLALVLGAWLVVGVALDLIALLPGWAGERARAISAVLAPRVARRIVATVLGVGVSTVALPAAALATVPTPRVSVAMAMPTASGPHWEASGPHWETSGSGALADGHVADPNGAGGVASQLDPALQRTPVAQADSAHQTDAAHQSSPATQADPAQQTDPVHQADPAQWVATAPVVRPQPEGSHLVIGPGWRPTPFASVVVHRGDTLWSIAAAHLGPGATESEVAQAWPRWYAANRRVIGPNPDVLLPGQILTMPGSPIEGNR